ncbi:hypothetical protein ACFPUW_15790 [Thalassorhabdus alkalitolerans]
MYVHGKSLENLESRNDALYKRWYRLVKKTRVNCAICQNRPIEVAHHLYGFDEYENVRFIPENGVALCCECHNDFHGRYSFGNNTLEQFKEYIQGLNYDTYELEKSLDILKPMLEEEIKKKKEKRKKHYSIAKLATIINEYPEIVRILMMHGQIKGAYTDQDGIWVIPQEEAEEFFELRPEKRKKLINCLVGKQYGNLTITKVIGRKLEGKKGRQERLYVEVRCKCGEVREKPYYSIERGTIKCSSSCKGDFYQ